jgi:hypothetical protein
MSRTRRFGHVDRIAEALSAQLQRFLDAANAADAIAFAHYLEREHGNMPAPDAVNQRLDEYFRTSLSDTEQRHRFLDGMLDEVLEQRDGERREAVLDVVSRLGGDDPAVSARIDEVRAQVGGTA